MTSYARVYAHKRVSINSDAVEITGEQTNLGNVTSTGDITNTGDLNVIGATDLTGPVDITGALTVNGVPYVPADPPVSSHVFVRLTAVRDSVDTTGFDYNLGALVSPGLQPLVHHVWAEIGKAPAGGYFEDSGAVDLNNSLTSPDITYSNATGRLTFNTPGVYSARYNLVISRISGVGSKVFGYYCAIGANGNPPGGSFGGGSSGVLEEPINIVGGCLDEIANPGDTRSLWIYQHDKALGGASEEIAIHAMNWTYERVV